MYFTSVDSCRYFAERLNNQPSVPNATSSEDGPKTRRYIAVCEPKLVNSKQVNMYNQVQKFDGTKI